MTILVIKYWFFSLRFSFPSIFIVYSVIALGVLEVLMIIGYFDHTSLFCSSRSLSKSIEDVTPFCKVQGEVLKNHITEWTKG